MLTSITGISHVTLIDELQVQSQNAIKTPGV